MAVDQKRTGTVFCEVAPAKINLFLHVLGRRLDGYHHIESLVSFADIGDKLILEPGPTLSLVLAGPFAGTLESSDDNLILKAARAFVAHFGKRRLGAFRLEKNLPVASGIGGGSSDAAAALRLLALANDIADDDPRLIDAARTLGADVPVCLDPAGPRLMHGIGHDLGNRLLGWRHPALLVNPGVAVKTRAVFDALGMAAGARFSPANLPIHLPTSAASDGPFAQLVQTRNDLEGAAIRLVPQIGKVLAALRAQEGCRFARMSGSGATCFAFFASRADADTAAITIGAAEPNWWCAPTTILLPARDA